MSKLSNDAEEIVRLERKLEAAEATLTAAQDLGTVCAHCGWTTSPVRGPGVEAALGSSPARLECDVCGFPEEGYPHPSGRCSKPDCTGTLRALGSSPDATEPQ